MPLLWCSTTCPYLGDLLFQQAMIAFPLRDCTDTNDIDLDRKWVTLADETTDLKLMDDLKIVDDESRKEEPTVNGERRTVDWSSWGVGDKWWGLRKRRILERHGWGLGKRRRLEAARPRIRWAAKIGSGAAEDQPRATRERKKTWKIENHLEMFFNFFFPMAFFDQNYPFVVGNGPPVSLDPY